MQLVDFSAVYKGVAVGVRVIDQGAQQHFAGVAQAVVVFVSGTVAGIAWVKAHVQLQFVWNAVAIGVFLQWRRRRDIADFLAVAQTIAIGVSLQRISVVSSNFCAVGEAIAVGVDHSQLGASSLLFEVGQAVAVEVFGAVFDAISVGIAQGWVEADGFQFQLVTQAIAVEVSQRVKYLDRERVAQYQRFCRRARNSTGQGQWQQRAINNGVVWLSKEGRYSQCANRAVVPVKTLTLAGQFGAGVARCPPVDVIGGQHLHLVALPGQQFYRPYRVEQRMRSTELAALLAHVIVAGHATQARVAGVKAVATTQLQRRLGDKAQGAAIVAEGRGAVAHASAFKQFDRAAAVQADRFVVVEVSAQAAAIASFDHAADDLWRLQGEVDAELAGQIQFWQGLNWTTQANSDFFKGFIADRQPGLTLHQRHGGTAGLTIDGSRTTDAGLHAEMGRLAVELADAVAETILQHHLQTYVLFHTTGQHITGGLHAALIIEQAQVAGGGWQHVEGQCADAVTDRAGAVVGVANAVSTAAHQIGR